MWVSRRHIQSRRSTTSSQFSLTMSHAQQKKQAKSHFPWTTQNVQGPGRDFQSAQPMLGVGKVQQIANLCFSMSHTGYAGPRKRDKPIYPSHELRKLAGTRKKGKSVCSSHELAGAMLVLRGIQQEIFQPFHKQTVTRAKNQEHFAPSQPALP